MNETGSKFLIFLGLLVSVGIVSFIYGGLLLWLWNAVVVVVFGAPVITFWQAYALCIIANILFGKTEYKSKKE